MTARTDTQVEAAAEIAHLDKRLGSFALRDVSLRIPTGYITGFVGPNGSGKTSTIKCLLGMLHPDAGRLTVLGQPAGTPSEAIGVVLDTPSLPGDWTVRQVGRAIGGFYRTWSPARFVELCGRFALPAATRVKDLSRGMGMKLQIAVPLSHETRLLVMDEPTSGLDPIAAGDFDVLIRTLQQTLGLTVFMITHDLDSLHAITNRVAVLADGKVVAIGPIATMAASEHPWVKTYFRGKGARLREQRLAHPVS